MAAAATAGGEGSVSAVPHAAAVAGDDSAEADYYAGGNPFPPFFLPSSLRLSLSQLIPSASAQCRECNMSWVMCGRTVDQRWYERVDEVSDRLKQLEDV